ncbi:MAG: alpha-glucan family phosphorylase [Verrucomicrobiales bacterium]
MHTIHTYNVIPRLPEDLEPLRELAFNLWWTWEPSARKLFRYIDLTLWEQTNHNPVRVLQLCKQARLLELADDSDFLADLAKVIRRFQAYMTDKEVGSDLKDSGPIAYFSAEFGFHESVPNYSGGLGILAGDHCKSASDLGLNFCAVGLLYRHGYFKQQINLEGWQEAVNLNQSFHHLPVREACLNGEPLRVAVDLPQRKVWAQVWELQVGRIKLYLLDTDIQQNSEEDRLITAELYGGDQEMRIKQELVLGIGGVHTLEALDINPRVYHMNEGHAAFLSLERIRRAVSQKGLDFYAALQLVAASNVFTTHTPVPAGNDAFPRERMLRYFSDYPKQVGIDFNTLFSFGQTRLATEEPFSMTILALRSSRHANGVSALHGDVSQGLWKHVWSGVPQHEVPITSITNGIHTKTWMAPEFADIYDRYLGPEWEKQLANPEFWEKVYSIPDDVIWNTHMALKYRLVEFVRARLRRRAERYGLSPDTVRRINTVLNPDILTIGFARRFATYKRGNLLFRDPERLLRMISHPERPVQFIFAGKAHPADEHGKKIIQEVYRLSQQAGFSERLVFVEDYDAYIGRRMYQGVDLWLNNPLRPLEASGTSGMKLPPSGGLNLSVLDGWWCEGYNGRNGWAIGQEITEGTPEFQEQVDVASLYSVLENQVVPLYYTKSDGRLPKGWIEMMRESIRTVVPIFNTHRMVREYATRLYTPAARAGDAMEKDNAQPAAALATWKASIREKWPTVKVESVVLEHPDRFHVLAGESLRIKSKIHLGSLDPEHVKVQMYYGPSDNGSIHEPEIQDLKHSEALGAGVYVYSGTIEAHDSGAYGYSVRVIPTHPGLVQEHELRLICWAP